MDAVLETRSLCKSFGALTVAQNIDFRLRPGERHALIGPNGAGKTTFVNMLMGALRPSSGRILLGLRPGVLLLDEPAAGVPSAEAERILQLLEKLPSEIAILIIEHDMDLVFRFARRITVLVQGEVLLQGTPQEVARDRRVHDVYLGEQYHA